MAVALPVIGPALRLSYSEALWVQAIYVLAMSVFLIPVGRLADKHGRLRFYLVGLGIFGVFSIACAVAFSGSFLVVMRLPAGLAPPSWPRPRSRLLRPSFHPTREAKGLGLNAMAGYSRPDGRPSHRRD